jgi:hypothetical protein
MNDNDLERELRSQRGPREDGYQPAPLPMTLEDQPVAAARPARLGRTALLVGVGAAGALAVAVVAGILSNAPNSSPDVGSGDSTGPSVAATTEPIAACGVGDIALAAEAWGGAAGSRGTVVTVSLTPGRYACVLPTAVHASVVDASGAELVAVRTPATGGTVALEPGATFDVGVAWSNWCGAEPAAPMNLLVGFGSGSPRLVGEPGSIPASAVPPCNGDGPSVLSLTDLQAQP